MARCKLRATMITYCDFLRLNESRFSDDHRYRYWLHRNLNEAGVLEAPERPVVFLMLNPSSAGTLDEKCDMADDPTVRRCTDLARRWGYTDRIVVNIFALVSTDPAELLRAEDPIGPDNDRTLAELPKDWPVVAAWGAHKTVGKRVARVLELLDRPLLCLKTTKDGWPQHPLYLKADLKPVPWRMP